MASGIVRRPGGSDFVAVEKLESRFTELAKTHRGYEDWMGNALFRSDIWRSIMNGSHFLISGNSACAAWICGIRVSTTKGKRFFDHDSLDPIVFSVEFTARICDSCEYNPSWYDEKRIVKFRVSRENHPSLHCSACNDDERMNPGDRREEEKKCSMLLTELSDIMCLGMEGKQYSDSERDRLREINLEICQYTDKHRDTCRCVNCGVRPAFNIVCRDCGQSLCESCHDTRREMEYENPDDVHWKRKRKVVAVPHCKYYCKKTACFHCGEPRKYANKKVMKCRECGVQVCKKCSTMTFDKDGGIYDGLDLRYSYKCGPDVKCGLCQDCGRKFNSTDKDKTCMCNSCYRCSGRIGSYLNPRSSMYTFKCTCKQKYGLEPGRDPKSRGDVQVTCKRITKEEYSKDMVNVLSTGGKVCDMDTGVTYQDPQV